MYLIIDIGNTRAKLLVFDRNARLVERRYSDSLTLDGLDEMCQAFKPHCGILSTVAHLGTQAEARLEALPFPLLRLDSQTALPVPLRYRRWGTDEETPLPAAMGADRIAALVGGLVSYPGRPLLIVDAGSCVTYEVVLPDGCYLGGNIAPGLQMRLKAMHEHTALLPLVGSAGDVPQLGYDTETCMRSGALLGLQYEIEGYVHRFREMYPELLCVLTSGDRLSLDVDVVTDDLLVAKGLYRILELHVQQGLVQPTC